MSTDTNNFDGFIDAVRGLAASQPRQEVTAPTADQVAIAAGILRLASMAEVAAAKIQCREMTREEWNNLADAYKTIGAFAAVEGLEAPIVDAPPVSEIEGKIDADPA